MAQILLLALVVVLLLVVAALMRARRDPRHEFMLEEVQRLAKGAPAHPESPKGDHWIATTPKRH